MKKTQLSDLLVGQDVTCPILVSEREQNMDLLIVLYFFILFCAMNQQA